LTTAGENDTGQLSVAATRHDALPLAPLGSSRSNKAFMITGIGVHDRVDWVFTITGMRTLDRLLARLHANKAELLMVLERPEIPLHTNGSENDIRCQVTRRKVSAGTCR
jgi:hypothetical protein